MPDRIVFWVVVLGIPKRYESLYCCFYRGEGQFRFFAQLIHSLSTALAVSMSSFTVPRHLNNRKSLPGITINMLRKECVTALASHLLRPT